MNLYKIAAFLLFLGGTYPLLDNYGTCENPDPGYAHGDSIRADYRVFVLGGAEVSHFSVSGRRGETYTVLDSVPFRYIYRIELVPVKLSNGVAGCKQVYLARSK